VKDREVIWSTNTMLKPKYKLSEGLVLYLALPGGRFTPLPPVSYATEEEIRSQTIKKSF